MATDFRGFVTRVEPEALEQYVRSVDGGQASQIAWDGDADQRFDGIGKHFPRHPKIWPVFEQAEAFKQTAARSALRSVLQGKAELLGAFDAMAASNLACALWLAQIDHERFENAVSTLNLSRGIGKRSWDAFYLKCDNKPGFSANLGEQSHFLRLAKEAIHLAKQAIPDGRLKARVFERLGETVGSHSQRPWVQESIYAEGPYEARESISDDDEIVSQIDRRLDPGAVLYDPGAATIEVVVLGGEKVRRALAEAFCKAFLSVPVELTRIVRRDIDFTSFKSPFRPPIEASDPIEDVFVDELRLTPPDGEGGLITLELRGKRGQPVAIFDTSQAWFDGRSRSVWKAGLLCPFDCDLFSGELKKTPGAECVR